MIFSLQNVINSLVALLTKQYPDYPVYDSPNQQGTKFPCFFYFSLCLRLQKSMQETATTVIWEWILYFVQQRNLVNGNQKIQEIAEFLDLTLDTFWYADNSDLRTLLPTSERQWNVEDEELHYQFHIRQRVALQEKENLMSDMEENDIGIKEDR